MAPVLLALLLVLGQPAAASSPDRGRTRTDDPERLAGIEQALTGRDRTKLPLLREWAARDRNERVRERSIGALTLLGDREAGTLIRDRLAEDPSGRVRRASAEAAGILQLSSLRPMLTEHLARDRDPLVRAECARALGRIPGSDSRPLLVALVADPSPEVRALCAEALAILKSPDSFELLRTLARLDPSILVRIYAMRGLAEINPSGSASLFGQAWKDSDDPDLRLEAYRGLLRSGPGEKAIEEGLNDGDERVRFLAFRAWIASRFPAAPPGEKPSASGDSIRRLTGFLTDPVRGIRELARDELVRQGFRLHPSGFGYAIER